MPVDPAQFRQVGAQQAELKAEYRSALLAYRNLGRVKDAPEAEKIRLLEDFKRKAVAMFNHWEAFIGGCIGEGIASDEMQSKAVADDCYVILHDIATYYSVVKMLSAELKVNFSMPLTVAYRSTQRMLATYSDPETVLAAIASLEKAGLSAQGCREPLKKVMAEQEPTSADSSRTRADAALTGVFNSESNATHASGRTGNESREEEYQSGWWGKVFGHKKVKVRFDGTVHNSTSSNKRKSSTLTVVVVIGLILSGAAVVLVVRHYMASDPAAAPTTNRS